jgi:hypothetical protein
MEANPEKLKACQETTACHEAMKADTKKTEPNPEMGSIMRSAWKKPQ